MDIRTACAGPEDMGARLDKWLSERFDGLSRSRSKALIEAGNLSVDGEPTLDPRTKIAEGREYALTLPDPEPAAPEPEDLPLVVLYEDEHLIIVNKAAGMAVHPAPGVWSGTLVNALLHHCAGSLSGIGGVARPGIVHRLDKETSGVMLAAKSEAAHVKLVETFQAHDIERAYLAVTRGAPRPLAGTVDTRVARSTADRKKMAVVRNPDSEAGKRAITHYRALETFGLLDKGSGLPAAALVECVLETGRTHQIRVHMAHIGAPLIGDPVYGKHRGVKSYGAGDAFDHAVKTARAFSRQALHARLLGLRHPTTGEEMQFEAPPPPDLAGLLAALRAMPGPR